MSPLDQGKIYLTKMVGCEVQFAQLPALTQNRTFLTTMLDVTR